MRGVLTVPYAVGILAALTVVPGPDMAVATKRAIAACWQDGLKTVGGVTAGLLGWGLLTVVGLAALLAASATAYTIVKLSGAAFLLVLGIQALLHSRKHAAQSGLTTSSAGGNPWRTGLISNLFNPKIAVFYPGPLPTLVPSGLVPQAGMAVLVLIHTALTLVWLASYVLLLAKARAFFEKPAVRRAMHRITGVVLIGFGSKVASSQP
ncbi:LysE family translocator [Amycolatopsis sp. AA4]|uniref:LysE family translocator n=2 Tax=Actinomycetes TaxID=1760 RepID=UPI0001DEE7B4|nr:LysE family translocator [Amycolatopsis sp. AA4]ATY16621.1 LysE family translocator [Amycolatopsis sp. AA4]EFL09439.1 homoserine/threonine efflux protein [Streptomyces sp. AA4]